MIFHENRLLADDSHEIAYLIFFRKLGKMSQNLSSAAFVIGALRVMNTAQIRFYQINNLKMNLYGFANKCNISTVTEPAENWKCINYHIYL